MILLRIIALSRGSELTNLEGVGGPRVALQRPADLVGMNTSTPPRRLVGVGQLRDRAGLSIFVDTLPACSDRERIPTVQAV
jgi:hypothetical protein